MPLAHSVVANAAPVERPTQRLLPSRPRMSILPSPLKSPTLTYDQTTFGFQVAHFWLVKLDPPEKAVHHSPICLARPVMSLLPSPLKSPTRTSAQVTRVLQVAHLVVSK